MPAIRDAIRALETSGITKIALEGREDPDVIPLWFGESDLVTPAFIRAAAEKALEAGETFYSYSRGHPALRAALLRYHHRIYGIELDPDRIHVPGSTMLTVMIACQCLLESGDEMIIVGPYWPNIESVVRICGANPVPVRLAETSERWALDLDAVAAAIGPRTKGIFVNTPSNPTGWVMSEDEQRRLLELCRSYGLGLIADEVYHRNVLDGPDPAPSFSRIAGPDEPVFVLNGFSKAWAMTGWRLGWMVAPQRLVQPMAVLAESNSTGSTVFAQFGAIAALEQGEAFVAEFNARCRRNRDLVLARLGGHPRIRLTPPDGAFYVFPQVVGLDDSLAFARLVLKEKVGIAPGYTFGPGNGAHFRLCFARDTAQLELALERIVRVLDRLG